MTDGRTELRWLRRAIAVPAVARKNHLCLERTRRTQRNAAGVGSDTDDDVDDDDGIKQAKMSPRHLPTSMRPSV